jgi:hypothetical protein
MLKTTAPTKSVPLRPMVSPILPAATDVTAGHRLKFMDCAERNEELTKSTNLENGDHGSNLKGIGSSKEVYKVRTCDNAGHNPENGVGKS